MKKILALWSTFRSTSTAFERMMRERGDFFVFHEPFGLYFDYSEERKSNRYTDTKPDAEYNYQAIWQKLHQKSEYHPVFIKDMPYYIIDKVDSKFIAHFQNTFLIRHPAKTLPSLFYQWPDFTLQEAGYEPLYKFFKIVCQTTNNIPVLIDSDDLIQKPAAMVKAYCDAVDIPFMPTALQWKAKKRTEMAGLWSDGSWYKSLESSHSFEKQNTQDYVAVDDNEHLKQAYEFCLPYYQQLYEHRLRIT